MELEQFLLLLSLRFLSSTIQLSYTIHLNLESDWSCIQRDYKSDTKYYGLPWLAFHRQQKCCVAWNTGGNKKKEKTVNANNELFHRLVLHKQYTRIN